MWKGLIVILVLGSLVFPMSAHAQEYQVKEVLDVGDHREAVLEDRQTGEVVQVRQGDMAGEWKVVGITETLVTLEKMVGSWEALRTQIPVRGTNVPAVEPSP